MGLASHANHHTHATVSDDLRSKYTFKKAQNETTLFLDLSACRRRACSVAGKQLRKTRIHPESVNLHQNAILNSVEIRISCQN